VRTATFFLCALLCSASAFSQTTNAGQQVFVARCASCHGSDGNGGELGPGIATRVPTRTDQELTTLFKQGLPASGMPSFANLTDADATALVQFLRTLKPRATSTPSTSSRICRCTRTTWPSTAAPPRLRSRR